jgi:hypothetical protein
MVSGVALRSVRSTGELIFAYLLVELSYKTIRAVSRGLFFCESVQQH